MATIARAAIVTVVFAAVRPALGAPAEEPGEQRVERALAAGELASISALELGRPTVFAFDRGGMRLELRVAPDGLVEVVRARAAAEFTVVGARGARAVFRLDPNERVSIWPVRWLEVRGGEGRLVCAATAADWTFTVRADRLRGEALDVACDDTPCRLAAGERLDLGREGAKTVFLVSGGGDPGRVVAEAKPPPPPPATPRAQAAARKGRGASPPLPFVATDLGAWEVEPFLPVSP